MKSRPRKQVRAAGGAIATPESVLEAARAAPTVFNVATYFHSIRVMRQKGYSWRYLADWLKAFEIEVSYVHLHRLYLKEDARLSRLTRKELLESGMPPELIEQYEDKDDPTKRLVAPDPEDEPEGDNDEQR